MKRRLIVRVVVYTLDDIDFSSGRPVGTITPEGWPSSAPRRHMHGIHDEKTAGEGILRVYPNALAITRDLRSSFDLHENVSGGIHTDQSIGLRILHSEESNSPVGGISVGPEVPTLKEARACSSLN